MKILDLLQNALLISIFTSIFVEIIHAIVSNISSNQDYKREYHKKILDKQFATYQDIEELLHMFSTTVFDYDKPYPAIFSVEHNPYQDRYLVLMESLTKSNIWLTEDMRSIILELNKFIFCNRIDFKNIEHGKKYYDELSDIRDKALLRLKKDIISLDNFNNFKNQKIRNGIEKIIIK